jgi:hypothetical protein
MIKVGDRFYCVHRHNKTQEYVTVTKVGYKYFYTDYNLKFEIDTLDHVSEFGSRYSLFVSQEAFVEQKEKQILWLRFKEKYNYSVPPCSLENLEKALTILDNED